MTYSDWIAAFFCTITTMSAFLLLNHFPKKGQWVEKTMTALVFLGSLGISVAPLCDIYNDPTFYELIFYAGVSIFACWLTVPYWRELPFLDRRKRRGDPTRRGETCSH